MANLIDLKDFACHWRFITRPQQLCNKSFLLPDIEISSFSLSCLLIQCFNRQASKRDNLAKERVANVSLGLVELHVPPWILVIYLFILFWQPKFFMATILQLKVVKRRLSEKVSLER